MKKNNRESAGEPRNSGGDSAGKKILRHVTPRSTLLITTGGRTPFFLNHVNLFFHRQASI